MIPWFEEGRSLIPSEAREFTSELHYYDYSDRLSRGDYCMLVCPTWPLFLVDSA